MGYRGIDDDDAQPSLILEFNPSSLSLIDTQPVGSAYVSLEHRSSV